MTTSDRPSFQSGVTLIELMVAMVLGVLVATGIASVFISTSASSRVQTQLAELQENGRFAITKLSSDLRMANGQYCTNTGGVAQQGTGGLYLDHLRTPSVYAKSLIGAAGAISGGLYDVTTAWGTTSGGVTYPAAPTAMYSMPAFLFMRGYDCALNSCNPVDPTVTGLPAMGTTDGSRVKGAAVLTLRYVNPSSGWTIGATGGTTIATSSGVGTISSITLQQLTGEPPVSNFTNGDLAMLADCSDAQIFAVKNSGGVLTPDSSNNFPGSAPTATQPQSAPKVFDLNRDFQTVTYYLKVVSLNNDGTAPFTGALMRRVNGGTTNTNSGSEDEIVRGIERLDFAYGVQDASGSTSYLTASQIEASSNCPPAELNSLTTAGCLWRSVTSIEVSALMDGQTPLYTLRNDEMNYAYSIDGINTPQAPGARTINPVAQGFTNQLLRREFIALVAVRNYNP